MQATMEVTNSSDEAAAWRLSDQKVSDLTADKRRLVEVPYTASLAHTMNALVANRVVAVPVAAPPGHWIGAGGSMILESDKQTGAVRKHYIGMVTMLDILAHIAGDEIDGAAGVDEIDQRMAVPVSSVIDSSFSCARCPVFSSGVDTRFYITCSNFSILDCMEVFSKGIHRALVPMDSQMESAAGVELVESASSYRMVTQMDLMRFLKSHDDSELNAIMSRTVSQLGAVNETIFGVTDRTKVMEAIKAMRAASLNAVPILRSSSSIPEDHTQLINGRGRKLIGTFSATDLRECPIAQLKSWLPVSVLEFTEKLSVSPAELAAALDVGAAATPSRELVTCRADSFLREVVDKVVTKHVHRVWVVDQLSLLVGLVSLTDIIRVTRLSLL
ncbi:hypothetical protein RJ639_024223 [Escallonia herrerae]|uniref:CBS domain-containing protein n=1 Tax=Escallonia herrerae TaxID=1293975 RepID=A0AA89AD31_9ASTE|nr:hypothetical protein RJ639_024223 [Escallonia herrerae]